MRLAGKTALVTGGSRGIGKAIVWALAREGAKVAFIYRSNKEAADQLVSDLELDQREASAGLADDRQFFSRVAERSFGNIAWFESGAGCDCARGCESGDHATDKTSALHNSSFGQKTSLSKDHSTCGLSESPLALQNPGTPVTGQRLAVVTNSEIACPDLSQPC